MVIVAECRTHAFHLIGGHGGAHSAAAYQDPTLDFSACYGPSERNRKIRVVVLGVIYLAPKIDDAVAFCALRSCALRIEVSRPVAQNAVRRFDTAD